MNTKVTLRYLEKAKEKRITVKVFIESGPNQPKTMLSGRVVEYDEDAIVLDECLIFLKRVISVAPYN